MVAVNPQYVKVRFSKHNVNVALKLVAIKLALKALHLKEPYDTPHVMMVKPKYVKVPFCPVKVGMIML